MRTAKVLFYFIHYNQMIVKMSARAEFLLIHLLLYLDIKRCVRWLFFSASFVCYFVLLSFSFACRWCKFFPFARIELTEIENVVCMCAYIDVATNRLKLLRSMLYIYLFLLIGKQLSLCMRVPICLHFVYFVNFFCSMFSKHNRHNITMSSYSFFMMIVMKSIFFLESGSISISNSKQ